MEIPHSELLQLLLKRTKSLHSYAARLDNSFSQCLLNYPSESDFQAARVLLFHNFSDSRSACSMLRYATGSAGEQRGPLSYIPIGRFNFLLLAGESRRASLLPNGANVPERAASKGEAQKHQYHFPQNIH